MSHKHNRARKWRADRKGNQLEIARFKREVGHWCSPMRSMIRDLRVGSVGCIIEDADGTVIYEPPAQRHEGLEPFCSTHEQYPDLLPHDPETRT